MSTTNDFVDIGRWIDTPFRYAIFEEATGILMQRRHSSAQEAAAYLRGTADVLGLDLCGLAMVVLDSTRR
jgi:AmiR/NasT family two-component response regulator